MTSWKFIKEFKQFQMFELFDGNKITYTINDTNTLKHIVHNVSRDIAEGIWWELIKHY